MKRALSLVKHLHGSFVFGRRARALAGTLGTQIPQGASILDIGCGDGTIAHLLRQRDPTLSVQGLETSPRPRCFFEYSLFDGKRIPFRDASFDLCLFVDVLHHTNDIPSLLEEACRVSRKWILVKDHLSETRFDRLILEFMDWVGNRPHNVQLTYNYQSRAQWAQHFQSCDLQVVHWSNSLGLYPFPFSAIFSRGLHFVALLCKSAPRIREDATSR